MPSPRVGWAEKRLVSFCHSSLEIDGFVTSSKTMTSKIKKHRNVTMHDMDSFDKPREKLRLRGETALSDAELIAILLSTGTAKMNVLNLAVFLLKEFGGVTGLQNALYEDLMEISGISHAKVCQLKAGMELGRRSVDVKKSPEERSLVDNPEALIELLSDMEYLDHEVFRVVLLDNKKRFLEHHDLFRGTINAAQIRPAEVFKHAIRRNAPAMAIAHNHPSGNPEPSPSDKALTSQLLRISEEMQIELVDHIVMGTKSWVSMKARRIGGF